MASDVCHGADRCSSCNMRTHLRDGNGIRLRELVFNAFEMADMVLMERRRRLDERAPNWNMGFP